MKSDTVLLLGCAALVVFILWKANKSTAITKADLNAAGLQYIGNSTMQPEMEQYSIPGGYVGFLPGDMDKLNFAQRFLIKADAIVPGSWLSRMVLGA